MLLENRGEYGALDTLIFEGMKLLEYGNCAEMLKEKSFDSPEELRTFLCDLLKLGDGIDYNNFEFGHRQ